MNFINIMLLLVYIHSGCPLFRSLKSVYKEKRRRDMLRTNSRHNIETVWFAVMSCHKVSKK